MTPTALTGDRLPAFAPLVTASAVRKGGIPARRATAIAMGATRATLAIAPGPTVETAQAMKKRRMGSTLASPAREAEGRGREALERPVRLGEREEQGHAGQGDEEQGREALHHGVRARPAEHAEDPGQGEGQDARRSPATCS